LDSKSEEPAAVGCGFNNGLVDVGGCREENACVGVLEEDVYFKNWVGVLGFVCQGVLGRLRSVGGLEDAETGCEDVVFGIVRPGGRGVACFGGDYG